MDNDNNKRKKTKKKKVRNVNNKNSNENKKKGIQENQDEQNYTEQYADQIEEILALHNIFFPMYVDNPG
ncbi:hypothetical protein PFFCH_00604 [Plasmodium falciparum FCH/4]|nr:hypothetical protein PFFCH_00604 [Plasmodium falciparum FCH/4]